MDRKTTVKYWQMRPGPVEGVEFEQSLVSVMGMTMDQTVTELGGLIYQLDMKPRSGSGPILGDLIRLQSEALPSKLKRGGKAGRLTLGDDEALGHHAGFIFDPKTRLLGMEIKMQAAGVLKLADIVATLAHHTICVGLPLLTTNGLDALAGTKNGTLTFQIADPAGLNAIDPDLGSVRDNITFLKEMVDGAYVNVSIGAGPRRDGLTSSKLVRMIGWLVNERDAKRGKVRSIKVVQPHQAEPVLDFVNARFSDAEILKISGDPDTDWPERERLLISSFAKARRHVNVSDN